MAAQLQGILHDNPVETIGEIIAEIDLSLEQVRQVQRTALDNGEPWIDAITVPLGLYLRRMEELVLAARQLNETKED